MAECPFIVPESEIAKDGNQRINYADLGGGCDYIFYDHDDGFGKITRVQFCKLIGRKRDVFECLNESEWRRCYAYRGASKLIPPPNPAGPTGETEENVAFPCCGGVDAHRVSCPRGRG